MPTYDIATQDMVFMYTKQLLTLRQISSIIGMSHTGVSKRLKKAGIIDSKVKRTCLTCGETVVRDRSRARVTSRSFCSPECYGITRANPDFVSWRQGSRIARVIVREYYSLIDTDIVHHRDSNQRNNKVSNLIVFASQSDHLKWHHKINKVEPLWDGRLI